MAKLFVTSFIFALLTAVNCTGYYSKPAKLISKPILKPAPIPEPYSTPSEIQAPIFSNQKVYIKKVASNINRAQVPTIIIESGSVPINMIFKSVSSGLNANQQHDNAAPQNQYSSSVDGQIILKHNVMKPVVQQVNEVIVPSRYLSQKVLPVKEYVKTIISKNTNIPSGPVPTSEPAPVPVIAPVPEPASLAEPTPASVSYSLPEPIYKPYYVSSEEIMY